MTIVSPKNIDQLSNETIKQLFNIDKKNLHCTLDEHIETIRSFVKKHQVQIKPTAIQYDDVEYDTCEQPWVRDVENIIFNFINNHQKNHIILDHRIDMRDKNGNQIITFHPYRLTQEDRNLINDATIKHYGIMRINQLHDYTVYYTFDDKSIYSDQTSTLMFYLDRSHYLNKPKENSNKTLDQHISLNDFHTLSILNENNNRYYDIPIKYYLKSIELDGESNIFKAPFEPDHFKIILQNTPNPKLRYNSDIYIYENETFNYSFTEFCALFDSSHPDAIFFNQNKLITEPFKATHLIFKANDESKNIDFKINHTKSKYKPLKSRINELVIQ